MLSGGLAVNIYGKDQDKLISISEDVMDMVKSIKEQKKLLTVLTRRISRYIFRLTRTRQQPRDLQLHRYISNL
ncbi:MAG: hypothetical protein ACLUR5_02820 [Eubacterium ventriosum]